MLREILVVYSFIMEVILEFYDRILLKIVIEFV